MLALIHLIEIGSSLQAAIGDLHFDTQSLERFSAYERNCRARALARPALLREKADAF
jgi:hypothetical protein